MNEVMLIYDHTNVKINFDKEKTKLNRFLIRNKFNFVVS